MIVASALKTVEGKVYTGKRHCDIFQACAANGMRILNAAQGFVTDTGEFLDRQLSAAHALAQGQIQKLHYGSELYSEDLW